MAAKRSPSLSRLLGAEVPLLGQILIDRRLREGGDNGRPLVPDEPDSLAGKKRAIVDKLTGKPRGLADMSLGLSPATRTS